MMPEKPFSNGEVLHNLPRPTCSIFVGMEKELHDLRKSLSPLSRHFLIAIDGIGGIGKSALVLETAHRYLEEFSHLPREECFDAIVWFSAKTSVLAADGIISLPMARRTLEAIYTTIGVVLRREDITRGHIEEQGGLVNSALQQQRTLLIVDNLETVDDERVNSFLQDLPAPTKAIVTTRHRINVAYPIRLTGLSEEEGLTLIAYELDRRHLKLTKKETRQLNLRTGGVPLAIIWSIARIEYGSGVQEVMGQLSEPRGNIASYCFEGMIERIRGTEAHRLLLVLALFNTDASRESLGDVAGFDADLIGRDEGLAVLEGLSLVNKHWNRFSMLPLTRIFVEHELRRTATFLGAARERWVDWALQLVRKYAPLGSLDDSNYTALQQDHENALAVIDWCYRSGAWGQLAELASHMCLFLYRQGLWRELTDIIEQGIAACDRAGDQESRAWLSLYAILVCANRGESPRAERLLGEVACAIDKLDSVSDELRESYMHRQMVVSLKLGDSAATEIMKSRLVLALEMDDNWRVVDVLVQLGRTSLDSGRCGESAGYLDRALEVAEDIHQSHLIAKVLAVKARLARELGDLDQAKSICQKAADILERGISTTGAYLALETARVHGELGSEEALIYAETALDVFSRLGMQEQATKCALFLNGLREKAAAQTIVVDYQGALSRAAENRGEVTAHR